MSASTEVQHRRWLFVALIFVISSVPFQNSNAQIGVPATAVPQMVQRLQAPRVEAVLPEALALGQNLLRERRYDDANVLFTAILNKRPEEAAALYGAALALFNLGRTAEAEPLARQAADAYFPKNVRSLTGEQRQPEADALILLALIEAASGHDAQALKSVERAAALAPQHFDAQFTLGRARFGMGDYAGAVVAFRAAVKLKPDDPTPVFFLATALENSGDVISARQSYREMVRRWPERPEGHLGLGVSLIKGGAADAAEGISELKIAVELDPNQYESQVNLGRALLAQKLAEESVGHLQRAAALQPANPEPHYQLALAYRRLGMNDKAVAETEIVKRIHETRRGERDSKQ
ncbi:MAG TPA: tetratricopeptide repeat protein [Pyrinomonadaceae bacterium]|nr:tetratricopeptide repeat protein [Pyrinomonadaceae bacterium]